MRRLANWMSAAAIGLAALSASPGPALARPKIEWIHVDVPEGHDSARISKLFKKALADAAKKANFGKAKSVSLSARITELTSEQQGDVLRVSCTVMGRVPRGPGARSRISFGGSPEERAELEKQVITTVANGLVARLAQIVRTQNAKAAQGAGSK